MFLQYNTTDFFVCLIEVISINDIFPMFPISNFDEGRGANANIMLINAVIFNNGIMDEFF